MIRAVTELTTELKTCVIDLGFYVMVNEAPTALKMTTATMYINYQLSPPINHMENNADREIQTLKTIS